NRVISICANGNEGIIATVMLQKRREDARALRKLRETSTASPRDFARSALECDASSHRFLRARAGQVEDRPDNLKRDSSGKYAKWPPRHDQRRELHSRGLKLRIFISIVATALFARMDYAASADAPVADSSTLDFKQWGLLATQDGGRRKPIDTFAKETLIRIAGKSTYTDNSSRKWRPNDFVLSALLETHDWKNEPMVLVSFGK